MMTNGMIPRVSIFTRTNTNNFLLINELIIYIAHTSTITSD